MPRQARIVVPGTLHHVTQRGNYQQRVFLRDKDFKVYGGFINKYTLKYNVKVYGYCLMTNHVHFIVEPSSEDSLARLFNVAHMRYAQYFNKQHSRKGHLWQGRFFSCFMDWPYAYNAIRYVENNPVRGRMVKNAWDYAYSSAAAHVDKRKSLIKVENIFEMTAGEWKNYLTERDMLMVEEVRYKTRRGLGIGDDLFRKNVEERLGRISARGR